MRGEGSLRARPPTELTQADAAPSGLLPQDGQSRQTALLYVPPTCSSGRAAPLVVMLHGAGGTPQHSVDMVRHHADASGFILLAPGSEGPTWDIIARRRYGPDVAAIDGLLDGVFERYPVDPGRLAIAGFSDGASYALSLGLMNGDLFSHVLAFSPGFMAPLREQGRPAIAITHGTDDRVLPIDRCSRRIVAQLREAGREVDYTEFAGGHVVPEPLAHSAFASVTRAA